MNAKYVGYRLAQRLSERLPQRSAFRLAERLADLQWRWSRNDREAVERNLSLVLDLPAGPDAGLVRDVFRNFGRYLVEFFTVQQVQQPDIQVEGFEHFEQARRGHRGIIVLTAHVGNWEVGAVVMQRLGLPMTAVALPHGDPQMDRLFNAQRQRCGLEVIPLGREAARRSLQSLGDGRSLGLLGDRDFAGNGLRMPFCGYEMTVPRGPAVLSFRSQAPAVPTFLVREGFWKFRLCFEPPIWPQSGAANEAAVRMWTQAYLAVFERYVKRFPDQWLMFQRVA